MPEPPSLDSTHVSPLFPPRFDIVAQRADFLAYLEKHGFAVVKDVATLEQVRKGKELLWEWLEAIPGTELRRDDVKTWGGRGWLASPSNGILHGFGFGQSDFAWHLRLLPPVKETFAAIWGTDDLLVSFDGGNLFRPWQYDESWRTVGGWLHVDQNSRRPGHLGKVCVQGLVNLCNSDASTGGFVVLPGSHKFHAELCERSPLARGSGDYVPVPPNDPILQGREPCLVCANAGDLIVWDSRTVHCNSPGWEERAVEGNWDIIRCVGYVCMTPARKGTAELLQMRREAYEEGTSTTHWPHEFTVAGRALPDEPRRDFKSASAERKALIVGRRFADQSGIRLISAPQGAVKTLVAMSTPDPTPRKGGYVRNRCSIS